MICSKCGKDIPDDSAFCPKCAAPTGTGATEVTPFTPVQTPPMDKPPKKKMKKGCIIALLIPLGLIVIFFVYVVVSELVDPVEEHTTVSSTTSAATATGTTAQPTTLSPVTTKAPGTTAAAVKTIKISAGDLVTAYDKDEASADKLYKGKLLEVAGSIDVLGVDSSPPEIDISNDDPMVDFLVQCFITAGSVKKAEALSPGSAVTVVGTCTGLDADSVNIVLKSSTIK